MRLPQKPPPWMDLTRTPTIIRNLAQSSEVQSVIKKASKEYLHWEDFRHKTTPPQGFQIEDVWRFLRWIRMGGATFLPLRSPDGQPFTFGLPAAVLRDVSFTEHYAGAQLELLDPTSPDQVDRDRYLVNSLMQEAITSSQLEGAAVTLEQGKEMLRTGRHPVNQSERMVLNNYRTILSLKELVDRPLSIEMIHDIQRGITQDALDKPDAAGRFRRPEESVAVYDESDGTILHNPPAARDLPERLARLCDFANDTSDDPFVPPVVRAILLHFWLAYEHPYCDGNGRTARALFYWYMLKSGYWLIEFVSVSSALLKAPAQYRNAFLFTESDDGDTTYFIIYHLKALRRALEELKSYIERKQRETAEMTQLLRKRRNLNHRQLALLHNALRRTGAVYTYRSHATSHRVSLMTARSDLLALVKAGFLQQRKRGRECIFFPVRQLPEKVRNTMRPQSAREP